MKENERKSPIGSLRNIWDWLTEPPASIKDPAVRRQARLLASLLVAFMLLTAVTTLLFSVPNPTLPTISPLRNPDLYVAMGGGILFVIAYSLNRAGRYAPAARLTVVSLFAEVYTATITTLAGISPQYDSTDPDALILLIVPILFTSVLLPIPFTISVVAANVVSMLLLALFFPQVSLADISFGPLPLVLAVATLTILAVHHQTRLEMDRRAELVEKEEQYRSLLETTFEGIIISGKEGKLIEANPGSVRMFGYTISEAIGMPLLDFISEDSRDQLANAIDTGAKQPLESVGLRKNGTEFHIELVAQALTYREQPVRVVAIRDITERKEAAETLRQQKRELELLNQVGRMLGSTLNLSQVLTIILEEVHRLLNVTAASAWLKDTETGELVC